MNIIMISDDDYNQISQCVDCRFINIESKLIDEEGILKEIIKMWFKKEQKKKLNVYKNIFDVYAMIKNDYDFNYENIIKNIKVEEFLFFMRVIKKTGKAIEKNKSLIEDLRLLEEDHQPEGYPVVKMKHISIILDILEGVYEK